MKILTFVKEIISVVLTPFILWFSLPRCAPAIIDFFREFTVHVDGLGFVCSFAVFDFQRHGNVKVRFRSHSPLTCVFASHHIHDCSLTLDVRDQFGAPTTVKDEKLMSKEGKMEKSFLNFKAAHPEWMPSDPSGSLYLSRMADYTATANNNHPRRRAAHAHTASNTSAHSHGQKDGDARKEDLAATMVLPSDEEHLNARAKEYERALHESQSAALARRKMGASGVMFGPGGFGMGGGGMQSTIYQSGMAQTAVLGDSEGSIMPPQQHTPQSLSAHPSVSTSLSREGSGIGGIAPEDRDADGGVGSALGESYVDGEGARRGKVVSGLSMQEEEEEVEDGGVLGLLAQIYSGKGATRAGPARVL